MSIIDRYIVKKFLGTFFFMLGIIMLFATVFDVSEKLSEFISNKAPISGIIFDYYVNFILFYGNMFSSMIVFLSVIWFTSKMASDTEIVPILFSGKPIFRLYRPYLISASILMIVSLWMNHIVVPEANKKRLDFENKYYRNLLVVEDYNAEFPNQQHVYFSHFLENENRANNFILQEYDENQNIRYFLKARYAKNEPNTFLWTFEDYYEKSFGMPHGELKTGYLKDTILPFQMEEMTHRENIAESMNYFELKKMIQREQQKGSDRVPFYEIELYQRTSYPFATYILTIIGVTVSSRKKRGGIGKNIALGLLFVFVYIFSMKMMTVSAVNLGMNVPVAVWIPNLLFTLIAVGLFYKSQR